MERKQLISLTLPSSWTTAEERMEVCEKCWCDPWARPMLVLPGQVPAGVCSLHRELPPSLVMWNTQGQSRKNLQLYTHEKGLKDPIGLVS